MNKQHLDLCELKVKQCVSNLLNMLNPEVFRECQKLMDRIKENMCHKVMQRKEKGKIRHWKGCVKMG